MSKTSSEKALQCFPKNKEKWLKKVIANEALIKGVSESSVIRDILLPHYLSYDPEILESLKKDLR